MFNISHGHQSNPRFSFTIGSWLQNVCHTWCMDYQRRQVCFHWCSGVLHRQQLGFSCHTSDIEAHRMESLRSVARSTGWQIPHSARSSFQDKSFIYTCFFFFEHFHSLCSKCLCSYIFSLTTHARTDNGLRFKQPGLGKGAGDHVHGLWRPSILGLLSQSNPVLLSQVGIDCEGRTCDNGTGWSWSNQTNDPFGKKTSITLTRWSYSFF